MTGVNHRIQAELINNCVKKLWETNNIQTLNKQNNSNNNNKKNKRTHLQISK